MIRIERRREDLQLNMAPMIDMVFLLIIFFLTATTFTEREREQDVLLPTNRNPGSLSRSLERNIIVNVMRDGSVHAVGRRMELDEFAALIQERRRRVGPDLKVQVRGDKRAAYLHVSKTLEVIERAGIERPYLVTKPVEFED